MGGGSYVGWLVIVGRAACRAMRCREAVLSNAIPSAPPRLKIGREVVGVVADVPKAAALRPISIAMSAFAAVLCDTVVPLRQSAWAAVVPLKVGGGIPLDVNGRIHIVLVLVIDKPVEDVQ